MLQFKNSTPFSGTIMLLPDAEGIDSLFTVVKGTFTLAERPIPAEEQLPIAIDQEHYGNPEETSIKRPCDVSLMKPGTDVLLSGKAYAPHGRPTTWMDTSLTVGKVRKTIRVFGNRVWRTGTKELSYSISEPQPFESMPLVWERAFGGIDKTAKPLTAEVRNPVGTGFRTSEVTESIAGVVLPNLEDPASPITAWNQRPQPAGFAPICAHWEPRRSYAGTYDEEWQKHRAPYLPKDFDPRFLQLAAPGLVATSHLKGGEPGELRGLTPGGLVRFRLPQVSLKIAYRVNGSTEERPGILDTLLIEPEESRLSLVWRAALQCDKKALRVSEIEAALISLN
jgi:hypothetical protein